jgi:protein LSM14
MTSMPEVGSKISLVSKADIRYEGRLFTVDPQECTIALANVRSFGTEDRETPYPIPPQPTVYDYILFRGSDIKDIRVINNVAIPNDPAIMQMHLPPQQNFSQNFAPMQHSNNSQSFGPFGHMSGNLPSSIGPNLVPSQQQPSSQQQNHSPIRQQQDSRSGTPQNVLRKSPSSSEVGVQSDNQAANKDKGPRNNQNQMKNNQRDKRDSPRHVDQENKGGYKNQRSNQSNNQIQNHQQQQHPHHQHQQQQRGGYRNNGNNNNKINNNHQQQGGRMIQGGPNRIRNNYNNKPQNNNKPNGVQRGNNKPNTLKFENEFDFEQGNNKFEEIRSQLSKLKVGDDVKTEQVNQNQVVNGDAEKKEDSGNETGADHEIECDDKSGYDKTKSFFDNISCEAVERSKGKMQRTDWRQERKINTETFGFSSNRRGNYRGRPQNNRGGSRPNNYYYRYNNQNSYRPRNNNSTNRNNQTNAGQNSSGANQPTQQKPSANVSAK